MRWASDGAAVAPDIIRWFVIDSHRLKTPQPGAMMRRYCQMFRADDSEALGAFALNAWIAQDLKALSQAEAEIKARAQAKQELAQAARYPEYFPDLQGLTEDQLASRALLHLMGVARGSAISSKGVLALSAACGGAHVAPVAQRYLKEWYGIRAAQSKALIQMLAWVEHPSATQLMLAVGGRFRTKGIQEEAANQARLLAERKGWTLDELADRTVPCAGFDETGTLELDYGGRRFVARLNERLEIELETEDGKAIKSLPEPSKSDDVTKAAAAKKALSATRKELKTVLGQQKDRLYEALCAGRVWRFEDWSLSLRAHPLLRFYCQRLVWAAVEVGKAVSTFRPLGDGSLTDAADNAVEPDASARVTLAHDVNCDPATAQAWLKHFADYDATPLLTQFGRGIFVLAEDRRDATSVDDFRGHMIDAFKLRGMAAKLGYVRGETEDGGWFYSYGKRLLTLGIDVRLEFSGNALPEENHKVALTRLTLGCRGNETPLSAVPPVLLSECWNDMRQIAEAGTGFDPKWREKTDR